MAAHGHQEGHSHVSRSPSMPPISSAAKIHGYAKAANLLGLLRPRRERPRSRSAAEQRDELAAAAHSITSSARSRNDSGMVSPRAFAVLRLMTKSNLTGCRTGRSEGLVPCKILCT